MRRREFIALLSGAVSAGPFSAWAQQGAVPRIGVLVALAADDPEMRRRLAVFRQELEKLGWTDGRNAHIDVRYAITVSMGPELAKELVALQPDVILAQGTPMAAAFQSETHKVPIVFVAVSDPIGSGFVSSLAKPGSNLTGLALYDASVSGKWIDMLKEITPSLARVAVLANPKLTFDYWLRGGSGGSSVQRQNYSRASGKCHRDQASDRDFRTGAQRRLDRATRFLDASESRFDHWARRDLPIAPRL